MFLHYGTTASATPVSANGRLQVKGAKIVNAKGKSFVIKGVSTHGLSWYPQYVNKSAFSSLKKGVSTRFVSLCIRKSTTAIVPGTVRTGRIWKVWLTRE